MTDAERSRRYRDRKRGGPPRRLEPCGTYAAFRRHERADEEPCDACREARNERQRQAYRSAKKDPT